ncbi:MAG: LysM peptidoglycan-binding domain-containing protein [Syntrophales bacterium]|nr:LysM peptidoglycan-binding domain-containing protein [Syntrophales bacterium]
MRKISRVAFLLTLFVLSTICAEAFASVDILNVRHWTAPDHTRVVLDLTGETAFKVIQEDRRIYVDLQGASLIEEIPPIYDINQPAVEKVLLVSLPGGGTRVELHVTDNVEANVFKLGIILDKPHRVVIDVMLPDVEKKESEAREKVKVLKNKVVVIDPGHGGEDPGAIGRRGTREKNTVFRIAEKLQRILKARGYEAFLTRKGDYFISLKERGRIAREYGADIFLSIHADACRSRGVRGTSVYCLSTGGASSEAAKLLAQNENLSDIIGGSENGNGNGDSGPIALNMLQTETINRSRAFGAITLEKIRRVNHLKSSRVQEAPFRVLKLPDITSLLIETAYISNPREELMLRSSSGQTDMAWAIAYAVDEFLPLSYPADEGWCKAVLTPERPSGTGSATYRVQKGDTLERIARRNGTTMKALMEINKIRSKNKIYIGQRLNIPSGYEAPAIPSVYVVKRGDMLERIAEQHDTTMKALMKANKIRSKNKIYAGQKLKIPSDTPPAIPSVYVVKRGDMLEGIASRYGTTMKVLMGANKIRSKNKIYVGQKLKLSSESPVKKRPARPSVYVVKRGDNLEEIASRYGTTTKALMETNKIRSKNKIYVGQKLKIPSEAPAEPQAKPLVYMVKRGDRLEEIARKHGTTIRVLMEFNKIKSRNMIYVGQKLKIPYV